MIRNYLKIAFRNLINQKGISLINIVGLSISLAVTLLMLLWVQDEWSTDRFHEKSENVYLTIVIAGMTVGVQTVKAGITNPIQSLRNEYIL